jgi:hypothetical protein
MRESLLKGLSQYIGAVILESVQDAKPPLYDACYPLHQDQSSN